MTDPSTPGGTPGKDDLERLAEIERSLEGLVAKKVELQAGLDQTLAAMRAVDRDAGALMDERDTLLGSALGRAPTGVPRPWLPPPPAQVPPSALPPPPVGARPPPPVGGVPPPGEPAEWREWQARPTSLRSLLLALGVFLLIVAGIVFVVITWPRLDDAGRGLTLLVATGVVLALTLGLRSRLPATAEAFSVLTLAMLLIDWMALRRGGFGLSLDPAAYWSAGFAIVAAVGVLLFVRGFRAPGVLFPIGFTVAALCALGSTDPTPRVASVVLGLLAATAAIITALLDRVEGWELPTRVCVPMVLLLEGATIVGAAGALASADIDGEPLRSATLSVLAVGLAPLAARLAARAGRLSTAVCDALVMVTALAVVAASLTAATDSLDRGVLALAAWLAVLGVLVARSGGPALRRGVAAASLVTALVSAAFIPADALFAYLAPLTWLGSAWTGDLAASAASQVTPDLEHAVDIARAVPLAGIGIMLAVLVAMAPAPGALAAWSERTHPGATGPLVGERPWGSVLVLMGLAVALLAPLSLDVSAGANLAWLLALVFVLFGVGMVAERAERGPWQWLLVGALALSVPSVGWAMLDETVSIVVLLGFGIAAVVAAVGARSEQVRVLGALCALAALPGGAAALTISLGHSSGAVGFVLVTLAALALVLGVVVLDRNAVGAALEAGAWVVLLIGLAVAGDEPAWRSTTLAVATVALAVVTLTTSRRGYAWPAAVAATGLVWSELARAGVDLHQVEAWSLPAAFFLLLAGLWYHRGRAPGSWRLLGPGLLVAAVPSTLVVLADGEPARSVGVAVAATVVVAGGVVGRLRAPVIIGAVVLAVLGVDTLGPAVGRLPRWVSIGGAGAVLLWLGATIERRQQQLRVVAGRFHEWS